MITAEQGFDMLPFIADIYEKVDIQKYILSKKINQKDIKDELQVMGFGLDMFAYVMKQSPKVKNEFFNIVAIMENKTLEEVLKNYSTAKVLMIIKSIFEDEDLQSFFK